MNETKPTQASLMIRVKQDDALMWLPNAETVKYQALTAGLTVKQVTNDLERQAAVRVQTQIRELLEQANYTEDRIVLPLQDLIAQAKEKIKAYRLELVEESERIGKLLKEKK